ncbi:hypothetical protein [Candidatus Avelusimicrobium faecicola]|uniref:hypothetical protein n=1 Tax=Candidatus Avelusimicrobium faecicola TaxID=3416205 RepID=UPI003D12FCD7
MNKFLALATAVLVSGVAFAAETWPDNQDNKTQKKANAQDVVNNPIQASMAGTPSRVAGERMDVPDIEDLQKREELVKRNRKNHPAPIKEAMAGKSARVAVERMDVPNIEDLQKREELAKRNRKNNPAPIKEAMAGKSARVAVERMDVPNIEDLQKREELAKRNRKNNPVAAPVSAGVSARLQSALEKRSSAKRSAADNLSDAQLTFARAWVDFTSAAKTRAYYDFNYNFQIMDPVREAFMSLSQEEQVGVANMANQPVVFKNGKKTTLEAYIRMESVNLTQREQAVFDAFRAALTKASVSARNQAVNPALPKAYARAVVSLRQTVSRTQDVNTVLQAVMAPMDEFYAQLEANPALGPAMAKEFVKPVQTSGGVVKPAEFISAHAIEVLSQPTQDKLFEFVKDLNRLSR